MKDLKEKVDALTHSLGLDDDEIHQRKAFLELTDEDALRLRRAHELLGKESKRFADAFYAHLSRFDAIKPLLEGDGRLDRLKHVQGQYFNTLTAGDYGPDYVRDRLRVGLVHQHIGLEPTWYLGAYRKYVAEMQKLLWQALGHEPDEYMKTCDALMKVVNFDIGLALDTYFHADTEEIREHKEYAESIVSTMPTGLMVVSANLVVLSMNPAMRVIFRLDDDLSAEGLPLSSLVKSSLLLEAGTDVLETGNAQNSIFVTLDQADIRLKLEFNLSCIRFRGKPLLLVMAQDITEKLNVKAKLAQSEERYRLTFNLAAVGMAQTDADGRITRINQKLCDVLGYERQELLGMRFPQLTHPDDRNDADAMTRRVMAGELEHYSKERRYLHKAGHVIWTRATVSCLREDSSRMGLIVVLEDISDRKRMEEALVKLAGHDALTDLPNRVLLQDRLSKALARAKRNQQQVAVMYLDLDRFKHVNDSQGHAAGDAMLAEAARRLTASVRETDTVARLGGDEFVVILENIEGSRIATARAQGILRALATPFAYKDRNLYTGASIGIALFPKDGPDGDTLLKHADSAMYQAKEAGRNNVQFYTPEVNAQHIRRLFIADGLRRALEQNELQLHYQPKIRAGCGRIIGVEALLRWTLPDGVHIAPDEFIPVAEDTGLILPIGQWVLKQACTNIVKWRAHANPNMRVSVNLSARQFKNQDIVSQIKKTLEDAQCPADALELEITESVLMERPDQVTSTLRTLHDMGIRLSIDDFGTGYSSLSYLRNFPIHELKIDRSFIEDITQDESHAAIVKAIITLAHSMKLTVLAEGVETEAQLHYLRNERCDHLQGYFFSRPLPGQALEELLLAGAEIT
ncbi:EAL domain-containing protein [Pusillimonas minor]|uniref:Diguanylate cyclase DosC n=1 Tax=Pusillimonas minor TaxID=2697024 RepID=A0A842HPN8_9BURK|nr:EAL domain-containing protein [Pusillimonas minor]MBC2769824.1 EAL domain-containing protein [Pusillimonas minor]